MQISSSLAELEKKLIEDARKKAEEIIKLNDTAEYRLYPSKGMVLLYDTAGKEIFYYAAKKDFKRLKDSLPKKIIMIIR